MNSYEEAFEHVLRRLIDAEISDLSEGIVRGVFDTLESYREHVGEVRGLKIALSLCDETVAKLEKE